MNKEKHNWLTFKMFYSFCRINCELEQEIWPYTFVWKEKQQLMNTSSNLVCIMTILQVKNVTSIILHHDIAWNVYISFCFIKFTSTMVLPFLRLSLMQSWSGILWGCVSYGTNFKMSRSYNRGLTKQGPL